MEVNVNYPDTTKIKQDCTKLIDPVNSFGESVYVAFGNTFRFRDSDLTGLTQALNEFVETDPAFQWTEYFGVPFHVLFVQKTLAEKSETGVMNNWTDNWALLRNGYCLPEDLETGKNRWRPTTRRRKP